MLKDLPEGQTHSFNDGCGESEHNDLPKAPVHHINDSCEGGVHHITDKDYIAYGVNSFTREDCINQIIYWSRASIDGIWWETDTRKAKRELRKYLDLLDNFNK